ncbi:Ankyrin repeat protein [Apiospora sp. TS-2023a]
MEIPEYYAASLAAVFVLLLVPLRLYTARWLRKHTTGIQQWLRESGSWFQGWKQFVIATGSWASSEEGVETGLVYTLALNGLPNILGAIPKGCDVNMQGGEYGNALQAASWTGSQEVVRLLLKKGIDVHAQGGEYGNALQAAIKEGRDQTAKLLRQNGAVLSEGEETSVVLNPGQGTVPQATGASPSSLYRTSVWWGFFFLLTSWFVLRFLRSDD